MLRTQNYRPVILLDLDGVCANLDKKWYSMYNEIYDDDLTPDRVKSWSTHEYVKPECGKKIYDLLREPGFFADLEPIEGAIEGVRKLSEIADIVVVTAAHGGEVTTDSHIASDKIRWVKKYFPFVDTIVTVTGDGAKTKSMIYGDILIDDGPHNLQYSPAPHKICVDFGYGYNKDVKNVEFRCSSWDEIVWAVEAIVGEEEYLLEV